MAGGSDARTSKKPLRHLSAAGNMNSYSPSSIDCKSAAACPGVENVPKRTGGNRKCGSENV
jgi:hypothetical protein